MPQQEIEVILARQLADYLAMPIFIIDPQGAMIYYNEPAEEILGCRFNETGVMPLEKWTTAFAPMDESGAPLAVEKLPLVIALRENRPAHTGLWIWGMDKSPRHINVTAIPLVGQAGRDLGAFAILWESKL